MYAIPNEVEFEVADPQAFDLSPTFFEREEDATVAQHFCFVSTTIVAPAGPS